MVIVASSGEITGIGSLSDGGLTGGVTAKPSGEECISSQICYHHCSLVSVAIVFCNLWLYVPSSHTGSSRNDTHKCIITFRFENFLLSTNRRDLICYRALDDVCFNINGQMRVLVFVSEVSSG
ncbi:hypothetical protein R1flu_021949 [Riccia fluitans]|uniref:Uncharacterized protein n=1 Tax=Riccia fluitans TaxID=41844 RepID=A0ABD1ZQU2_9MARC